MILRERICVAVPAAQLWTILGDPARMSRWNPHCVHSYAEEAAMHVGLRFKAVIRMGRGPEHQTDCEVIECEPDRILTLRFSGEDLPRAGAYVDETLVLRPVRGGTEIVQKADFSHSGLPWFVQVLMKILFLVGRREGRSPLDCLKELAEGPS
jgi:uncharacterized protein YndB with AHSA1/START domain